MNDDLYPRPSRAGIEARVKGALPGAPAPPMLGKEAPGPVQNFATHLTARMRALGWDQAALQEHAGITAMIAAKTINGTGIGLELAGQLAELTGSTLAVMIGPYTCATCRGEPPRGFGCLECGAKGWVTA